MSFITRYVFNRSAWFIAICGSLLYFWLSERLQAMELKSKADMVDGFGLKCGMLLGLISVIYCIYNKNRIFSSNLNKSIFQFIAYFNVLSISIAVLDGSSDINTMIVGIFPLILYFLVLIFIQKADEATQAVFLLVMCMVYVALFTDFVNSVNLMRYAISDDYLSDTSSYFILFFAPFGLCLKRNWLKYAMLSLSVIAMLLSGKRSGFIAFLLMIAAYFFIDQVFVKGTKVTFLRLFLLLTIGGFCFYALLSYMEASGSMLLEKFSDVQTDKGSGRIPLWGNVFDSFLSSNILEIIFGHGYLAVSKSNSSGLTAHNDFLEILYDYGILGFILFIRMIRNIVNEARIMIRNRSQFAGAFVASIVVFLTNGFFSHVVVYFAFFSIFTIFWAYIVASYNYETNN